MDLLLDINVAVDICTKRQPFYNDSNLAIAKCVFEGSRIWIYAGSVQTLEYVTRAELKLIYKKTGQQVTTRQLEKNARDVLKELVIDKHWLASSKAILSFSQPRSSRAIICTALRVNRSRCPKSEYAG